MKIFVLIFFASLLFSGSVFANRQVVFFVEPSIGVTSLIIKGVEIEQSFVTPLLNEDGEPYAWTDIDLNAAMSPVGRMTKYQGTGMSMTIGTGLKISGLRIGTEFSYSNLMLHGYSKRYMYYPEYIRASGKKLNDNSHVPIYRLMGKIKYGIPVRRLVLNFQTRIGAMFMGNTALVVGRAMEKNNAITADIGIDVSYRPNKWFSVGILGYVGFFAFAGQYDASLGGVFGGDAVFTLYF